MARWMGVLALEPVAGATLPRQMLSRAAAEQLVQPMAQQLGRFLSVDHEYGLAWAAAAYDPAQLLRRGFPLHHELAELFHAGQRQGLAPGQTLTLAERDGRMPTALLVPELALGNASLLVIPVVLSGSEEAIALAQARLESELFEAGLADPTITLGLAADYGIAFEHVRWLSIMDLVAMMAAQLDNIGFGPAWQLIEEHLLGQPAQALEVQTALGQRLRLDEDAVWMEVLSYSLYARLPGVSDEPEERIEAYVARVLEQRQIQALLQAHGLPLRFRLPQGELAHACSRQLDDALVEQLAEGEAAQLLLHEHPALGVLACTLLDASGEVLEHRYPLAADAIRRQLRAISDSGLPLRRPRQIILSADGLDLGAGAQET